MQIMVSQTQASHHVRAHVVRESYLCACNRKFVLLHSWDGLYGGRSQKCAREFAVALFQVMGLLSLSQNDASFGRLLPHKTPELRDCLLLFIFHFFSNFRAQSLFAIFVTDPTFSGILFVVLEIVVWGWIISARFTQPWSTISLSGFVEPCSAVRPWRPSHCIVPVVRDLEMRGRGEFRNCHKEAR